MSKELLARFRGNYTELIILSQILGIKLNAANRFYLHDFSKLPSDDARQNLLQREIYRWQSFIGKNSSNSPYANRILSYIDNGESATAYAIHSPEDDQIVAVLRVAIAGENKVGAGKTAVAGNALTTLTAIETNVFSYLPYEPSAAQLRQLQAKCIAQGFIPEEVRLDNARLLLLQSGIGAHIPILVDQGALSLAETTHPLRGFAEDIFLGAGFMRDKKVIQTQKLIAVETRRLLGKLPEEIQKRSVKESLIRIISNLPSGIHVKSIQEFRIDGSIPTASEDFSENRIYQILFTNVDHKIGSLIIPQQYIRIVVTALNQNKKLDYLLDDIAPNRNGEFTHLTHEFQHKRIMHLLNSSSGEPTLTSGLDDIITIQPDDQPFERPGYKLRVSQPFQRGLR